MKCSMQFVIILIALSLIKNCEPDEIIGWNVPRRFCSSDIPNIMGLVCRPRNLPSRLVKNIMGRRHLSFRRGIVDDCCKNACTPLYMQEYCHSDLEKTSTDVVLIYTSRREYKMLTTTTTTTPKPTPPTTTAEPLEVCYPKISITWI